MENDKPSSSSIDTMFSFDDYVNYQNKLESYNKQDSNILFFNESGIHAAIVIRELIERAKLKKRDIDMFCGTFFLFREKFHEVINHTKDKLKETIGEDQREAFNDFDPYGKLMKSLQEFFAEELHMNVILQKENIFDEIKKEKNWDSIFKENMSKGFLCFYQLDSKLNIKLDHFIVSGTSFRKENSDIKRTAMCSFNRPEYAKMYQKTFNLMKEVSTKC